MVKARRPGEEPTPWGLYVAAAVVAVVAIGAVLFFALQSGDEGDVRIAASDGQSPETTTTASTSSTTLPTTSEPSDVSDECSAKYFAGEPLAGEEHLPPRVAERRRAIIRAAKACDFEELGLNMEGGFVFEFGSPERGPDAAVKAWKEAERRGEPIIYSLLKILQLDVDRATDGTYVWPAASQWRGARWQRAGEEELDKLAEVYGEEEVRRWQESGTFDGYRVGIRPNGGWFYFTGRVLAVPPESG